MHETKTNHELPIDRREVPLVTLDWFQTLPWWRLISRSISISWRLSHLMVAAVGIWLTQLSWELTHWLFGGNVAESGWIHSQDSGLAMSFPQWMMDLWSVIVNHQNSTPHVELARWIAGILLTVLVWSLFGGVLVRRSVVELGTLSSIGWVETWKFVARRVHSMVWSLGISWLLVTLMLLPAWMLGWVARLGTIGDWLSSIGLVLLIPLMVSVAWLVLQSILGFPLSIAGIVSERKADSFDGFSRSAAYLFQRPFTVVIGVGLFVLLSSGLSMVVQWSFDVALDLFAQTFRWSAEMSDSGRITWSKIAMRYLADAFVVSFFWSAVAAMYLVLRYEVDQTDFDDLDLPQSSVIRSLPDLGKPPNAENHPALSGENETAE